MTTYSIKTKEFTLSECEQIILVEQGEEGPKTAQIICHQQGSNVKHQVHSLAQMVYYQFQDKELEIVVVDGQFTLSNEKEAIAVNRGLCIARTESSIIHVLLSKELDAKQYIENAYRYCTRWVRLDI